MHKHSDIPGHVYNVLRAIHKMRMRRIDADMVIPYLANPDIFAIMPDHKQIDWSRAAQPAITEATLRGMANTVEAMQ